MRLANELIERYIITQSSADPNVRKEPYIRDKGTPVWVIVGYHQGGHSPTQTASAFALTEEEVQAALCYYQQHEAEIRQRIDSNEFTL